jgi:hypothetical protein
MYDVLGPLIRWIVVIGVFFLWRQGGGNWEAAVMALLVVLLHQLGIDIRELKEELREERRRHAQTDPEPSSN